jgi:hypothetical protein
LASRHPDFRSPADQFVTVLAASTDERRGIAVSREAVLRRANGQSLVFGLETEASVFTTVADHYRALSYKPFAHIVVDEVQDLGVP